MKSLSVTLYNGCGHCYLDGTNELIADNEVYSSDEDSPSNVELNLSDKLPDSNKVNVISIYNTGEDLAIVEDTVQDRIKQENPDISDISDNIPNNKVTNNKLISELM